MELLLGFATGLLLVMPVGPITLTIAGIGMNAGRPPAFRAAGGVVLADAMVLVAALLGAAALLAVPRQAMITLQVISGLVLVVLGVLIVRDSGSAMKRTGQIRRPGRTLFLLSVGNPQLFIVWVGLVTTVAPVEQRARLLFVMGALLASLLWHLGLALASGILAERLPTRILQRGVIFGGWTTAVMGAAMLFTL